MFGFWWRYGHYRGVRCRTTGRGWASSCSGHYERLQLNSFPSKEQGQDPINGFVNRWRKHSGTGRWASQTAAGGRAICEAAASGQGGLQGEVSEGFFVVELFLAGIRPLGEVFWKQSPAAKMGIVDSERFRLRRGGRDQRLGIVTVDKSHRNVHLQSTPCLKKRVPE